MADILIIEDEPQIRFNLQLMLSGEGHHVRTAANGAMGLEELRRQLERVLQRVVEQNQLENPSSCAPPPHNQAPMQRWCLRVSLRVISYRAPCNDARLYHTRRIGESQPAAAPYKTQQAASASAPPAPLCAR